MKISFGSIEANRQVIISQIKQHKYKNPNYKVIDIGGHVNGWSRDIADLIVDINSADNHNSLRLDICRDSDWHILQGIVELHGKFDYCICTHTVEDLYNPFTVLDNMSKIAKAGVITTPSIYSELSRLENINWLGFIHHRWLFHVNHNTMIVIPKLNCLESLVKNNFPISWDEIVYEWSDNINYKIFMDNYLGPDTDTVIKKYQEIIMSLK